MTNPPAKEAGYLRILMILTKEILEAGKSRNGAWSRKQLAVFGLKFNKLQKGWQRKLIGSEVSESSVETFLALKDAHLDPNRPAHPRLVKKWRTSMGKWTLALEPARGVTQAQADAEIARLLSFIDGSGDNLDTEFLFATEGI